MNQPAAVSSASGSTGPNRTRFEANVVDPRAVASIERPTSSSPTKMAVVWVCGYANGCDRSPLNDTTVAIKGNHGQVR
jgi:hypothetical protein